IEELVALARRLDARITAVLETHLHADFVGGARELATRTGARIFAAARAGLEFAHVPVDHDTELHFGDIAIRVLETPGHTPEHIAFIASRGHDRAVFSGGSLIAGGAARTDLTGGGRTDELARAQFASVRMLAALSDDTALYPTHGAGSFCSTGKANSAAGTIGDERAHNPLLAIADEHTFVQRLTAGFGSFPTYFSHLRAVNREGAPLLATLRTPAHLDAAAARAAIDSGAVLVDARPVGSWAAGHVRGAVSIELRPAFASWLGWAVPFGAPIVIMIENEGVQDAIRLARRIGYDRLIGWTTFDAWLDAGYETARAQTMSPAEVAARDDVVLLDVRQAAELSAARIPGAMHIELGELIAGKTPDAHNIAVFCGHGERSATAVSLLEARGVAAANLDGGLAAWRNAGLPVEP
ncbi:MAG TPA: rhodanese-like domain-containing protein, partial [Actinomycetota bacterium]|nr:rhodanese-like domain-containing protein [Actinomycetota bacterium]